MILNLTSNCRRCSRPLSPDKTHVCPPRWEVRIDHALKSTFVYAFSPESAATQAVQKSGGDDGEMIESIGVTVTDAYSIPKRFRVRGEWVARYYAEEEVQHRMEEVMFE